MEEMAARELPHLGITTQAYGISVTGQINQLPFYDEYARHLNPKLLVLVFYINDFPENSTVLKSLMYGEDLDRAPFMSIQRDESGAMKLRPPDPEYARFRLPRPPKAWHDSAWERLVGVSYFAKWLDIKKGWVVNIVNAIRGRTKGPLEPDVQIKAWENMIVERTCCSAPQNVWQSNSRLHAPIEYMFKGKSLPPVLEEALEYTAFGIDQFKRRAVRDGVNLAMLSVSVHMGTRGDPQFDRLSAIAETRGIPVISDYEYIARQGYNPWDGKLRNAPHWNATGHQWAAEAVLEWLKENQDVCD